MPLRIRVGTAVIALVAVACSGATTPSGSAPGGTESPHATPAVSDAPATSPNATPAVSDAPPTPGVVVVNVESRNPNNGYRDVVVWLGVANTGPKFGFAGGFGVPGLTIDEGRTYGGIGSWPTGQFSHPDPIPVPPGYIICGYDASFAATFMQVPAAAHPKEVFTDGQYGQALGPSFSLAGPFAKCALPNDLPTSVAATTTSSSDPGFTLTASGWTVSITNRAPLDPIDGADVLVLTDKAILYTVGSNRHDVGPGQTGEIEVRPEAFADSSDTTGKAAALLVYSRTTQAYAVVALGK